MSSWQPIETAPKDAKRIELWFPHAQRAEFGNWYTDQYAKKPRPFWSSDLERIFGKTYYRDHPPSHWRPMSAGPTQETGTEHEPSCQSRAFVPGADVMLACNCRLSMNR